MTIAYFVLLRYGTSRWIPVGRSGRVIGESFRRNLEVRALGPMAGASHESLLSQLVQGQFGHISEIQAKVEYRVVPPWPRPAGPYAPLPEALSSAESLFAEARTLPPYEDDLLDNISVDEWDKLYALGKVGLWVYCRNHASAELVTDPRVRGGVIQSFLRLIDHEASRIVDIPDFRTLAASLRLDSAFLPPHPETPIGLLKEFSRLLDVDRTFEVKDPLEWWRAHEAVIPDLQPTPNPNPVSLADL
jgi:hypothetical protein